IGSASLRDQMSAGINRLLVGLVLEDKGIPRHGYRVRSEEGEGQVTSGNLSPMLDRGIALAYLSPPPSPEAPIEVEIRGRWVPGRVARPPFHKR
ncbi:MAG TPA: glycine cleavage T C-terminal barrel domain-containing protein, partial [Acidimicrobiia bacterium]|nr:glycine cleavage T C-terminal barrel domain-containing protein [Acidimicrobiia bacterium]